MYVGETGTTLYERCQNHISSIRRHTDQPVAVHFNLAAHTVNSLEIFCLENLKKEDIHLRKIRESFWITKLKTIHPFGLNMNYGVGDGIRSKSV